MDAKDDAAALDQLHKDFVEAFRSNDPEAMGAFFSEAAVLLPPRRALVSGKANVVAFWQNAQRIQDLVFEATDVELLGDTVLREAGNLQMTMRGEGRETRSMPAKYIAIWVKAGDSWTLDSLVWNGAAGQQQAGGGGGRRMAGGGQGQGGGYGQQGGGGGYGQRPGGRGRQGGGGRRGGGGRGPGGGQGGGQGGGYGQGGGGGRGGRGGGAQGAGGYGQGGGGGAQDGYGRGGNGYGQGGGQGGGGQGGGQGGGYGQPGGGGGGGGGGGFGRRGQQQRAHEDAPMIPRVD